MSETEDKKTRETLFSFHGADSVFAIEREVAQFGITIRIVEKIDGAEPIHLGYIHERNVGRFLTWLNRLYEN